MAHPALPFLLSGPTPVTQTGSSEGGFIWGDPSTWSPISIQSRPTLTSSAAEIFFFQNMCLYFSSLFFSIVLTWQVVQLLHTTDMSPHLRISGMSIVEASHLFPQWLIPQKESLAPTVDCLHLTLLCAPLHISKNLCFFHV